ncbi:hypothetical protein BCR39DRAFT_580246 [Naematelia encephala]|uniref:Oxidoreductase n=1 Tax=Naematelia encephala TaxID=71784 RepID=A0A1Y2ASC0_9TREE|nr:hypothetical protein BCR39DRAFT_580246 [Naematelia encephala]
MSDFRKVALITGCSAPSGLGATLARELHSRGWEVFATARKSSSMTGLATAGINTLELDVASKGSVEQTVHNVFKATDGRLDLLINNAAKAQNHPLLDFEPDAVEEYFAIHVFGPLRLMQAFAKPLIKTKGTVVNIGTISSHGLPWQGIYASSKAAAQVQSDVLRRETAPLGLKVITVELGMVNTTRSRLLSMLSDIPNPPSILYPNFAEITRANIDATGKNVDQAPKAESVAKDIINAVDSGFSGKMWTGKSSSLFRWMFPVIPISWQDWIYGKIMKTDMIKPVNLK